MNDMTKSITIGRRGEIIAAEYLEQNGFRVIEQNYRNAHQEIDLIAIDDAYLIFCEVKTRSVASLTNIGRYGRPARAVDTEKQKNLIVAARAYLKEQMPEGVRIRFDVIEVYLRRGTAGTIPSDILKIHHIRNAFGVSNKTGGI